MKNLFPIGFQIRAEANVQVFAYFDQLLFDILYPPDSLSIYFENINMVDIS